MEGAEDEVAREEASMPVSAVSLSRISPTMMTSGSARRKARIAPANVNPILGFT